MNIYLKYYEYKTRKHIKHYSSRAKQVLLAYLIQFSIHFQYEFPIKVIKTAFYVEKYLENIYTRFLAYLRN